MEDEDTYGIVSSLLDSDSSSEEEKQEQQQQQSLKWDATKKIVDLEHQVQEMDTKVSQLQAANKRLKDLVFDVKRNPSQYEGKDITQLLRDIDSNATTSPRSGDSDSINDLVLPFEAGIFAPLSFLSLDPDSDVGRDGPALQKPQQFASSSSSSSSAPASTGLSPVVIPCDSKAQLEQGQHRHQQPRKRSKSFEGRLLSGGITLYDYKGSIVGLSKYQPGCRFIQRQLDTSKDASEEARLVEMVLDEVMPSLAEVLTDTYGQYLVPNIVSHSSSAQRTAIIQALAPKIYELSCNACGSHGLQKMLAHLNDSEAELFGGALDRYVLALSKDPKGNYILQTYLKLFGPGPRIQFIVNRLCEHICEVSTHKVGCTVVCKCVEAGSKEQQRELVVLVAEHALEFVQDQFANYIVQDILSVCSEPLAALLMGKLRGSVATLCFQKFSSNVVEKCLEAAAGKPEFGQLYEEITGSEKMLKRMLQDPYGNFVVQKLLDTSDPERRTRLVNTISPLIEGVKTSQYAIHIHKKIMSEQQRQCN